jgi:FMN phosphatase YigB (HAD superfamily)
MVKTPAQRTPNTPKAVLFDAYGTLFDVPNSCFQVMGKR